MNKSKSHPSMKTFFMNETFEDDFSKDQKEECSNFASYELNNFKLKKTLLKQLSLDENEIIEKYSNILNLDNKLKYSNNLTKFNNLNRLNNFKNLNNIFSVQIDNENAKQESNLVLINLKKIQKRDFYSEIRAEFDKNNYLPNMIIQINVKEKSYKEILCDLATQMLEDEPVTRDFAKIKNNFFIDNIEFELTNKIQSIHYLPNETFRFDESWICTIGKISKLKKKKIGLAILKNKTNLGPNATEIQFILLVLSPIQEKLTKNNLETACTFATLFCDQELRKQLLNTNKRKEAIEYILIKWNELTKKCELDQPKPYVNLYFNRNHFFSFGTGLLSDLKARSSVYLSDFTDGLRDVKTINKLISTILMLYFSILMPAIAFGIFFEMTTKRKIDTGRTLFGQAIGGLFYALFSGQHMSVIGTTTLVTLYTKVVYDVSETLGEDFNAFYACVGLWSSFFVYLYSLFGLSYLIKYCTRSIEEIYSAFVLVCFVFYTIKSTIHNFSTYYFSKACLNSSLIGTIDIISKDKIMPCQPENSLQFLILMFGTVWLAVKFYEFSKTAIFTSVYREIISEYALPLSILLVSLLAKYILNKVSIEGLNFDSSWDISRGKFENLSLQSFLIAGCLGLALSVLFYIDQNLTVQILHQPTNNLKKSPAYHLDLLVLGTINGFLSLYCLPWMHAILPQSPMNIQGMADLDKTSFQIKITNVRETRLTTVFCNILIYISLYMTSYFLDNIPTPVLNGLFLYCAIAILRGNSFIDRILLIFTEQISYPPTSYVRKCPQRKLHLFTLLQFLQLLIIMLIGFSENAYIKMAFPVFVAILIPIRYFILPKIITQKYLEAIESYN